MYFDPVFNDEDIKTIIPDVQAFLEYFLQVSVFHFSRQVSIRILLNDDAYHLTRENSPVKQPTVLLSPPWLRWVFDEHSVCIQNTEHC